MNQKNEYNEAEKSLRVKITEFTEKPEIQSQLSEAYYIWLNDPYIITDYLTEDDIDDETFTKFFDWFLYDFRLLDSQKRVIEKFYDENKSSLEDIEKKIAKDWQKSVNSFFEIIDISEDEGCTIKDIFTNEVFFVVDKNAAKNLTTSDLISARPLKTGKEFHFSGMISAFTKLLKQNLVDRFKQELEIYKKEHGKEKTVNEYLKDWGYMLSRYIEDLLENPQYINADGEEFVIAKAYYSFKGKKKLLGTLRKDADLKEVSKKNSALNVFILKSDISSFIEVEKNSLTIESNSEKALNNIKTKLEDILKNKVKHKEDTIKRLDSFVKSKEKRRKKNSKLENKLDEYYDNWIKTPLERLNGKTPIEAAKDKNYRKELELALFELEKLYDDAKKHGEPSYDIKKIREKLLINQKIR